MAFLPRRFFSRPQCFSCLSMASLTALARASSRFRFNFSHRHSPSRESTFCAKGIWGLLVGGMAEFEGTLNHSSRMVPGTYQGSVRRPNDTWEASSCRALPRRWAPWKWPIDEHPEHHSPASKTFVWQVDSLHLGSVRQTDVS